MHPACWTPYFGQTGAVGQDPAVLLQGLRNVGLLGARITRMDHCQEMTNGLHSTGLTYEYLQNHRHMYHIDT